MTQALTSGATDEDATEVIDQFELTGDAWKPFNVTHAKEPTSSKRPGDSMLSNHSLHRYVIVALLVALGITLLVMIEHRPVAVEIFLGTLAEGWLIGQLWRWEPPR